MIVGISTAPALLAQREQSRSTVIATLIAALAGALVLSLTLGTWMRRLQSLADASHSISRGDFTASIHDSRDDEIGKLARSFDSMRLSLQERDRQLREFTGTLQEQVKQRTKELELALTTAEEANRAKSLFLANMSHELRTPLNGVIGMVDLMLGAGPNDQQRRYCEVAKSSAHSLLELINDILDFSKIEAGKLEIDETDFDLHETIESVVQMVGERAEKKKIELACGLSAGVPRTVGGDPVRLRQVLVNLVSNALKFTDRGEVVIDATLQSQTESHAVVRISVRDSGIGIPPDRLNRLFKSFSQVDTSTTRKFGGTGLGLAISQRIVEMMGGQIGVDSQEGKGSTFWFTVRLAKRAGAVPAVRDANVDPRGLRVLAVDDNQTNREIIQAQLTSWSLRADVAENATQAMEMLHKASHDGEPYKFVILDMHMPKIDGMELARQIKADLLTRNTILISLSSMRDQLKPQAMVQLGFSACLSKPALPSQLYNAIVDSLAADNQPLAPARKPSSDEAVAIRLGGLRVLLAEDNEVNRLVASELLRQAGCECEMAVNGREAVTEALRGEYDLILMDCQMPELDGFEATRAIRDAEQADPFHPHRPIVALTANAIKGDRELCLAAGMDGYVTKPIDPVKLFQTMQSFVPPQRLAQLQTTEATRPQAIQPPAPVAPVQSPIPTVAGPPVDVESLRRRCMGNRKIAIKALNKFESSAAQDVLSLAESARKGDAKSVAASAHKIKGAAANVSAEELRKIAAELEQLAKADELAQSQACVEKLQQEMKRFAEYLATAIAELTPVDEMRSNIAKGSSL